MEKQALYPGSFDPFTRGHEDIVHQGQARGWDITVGVGENKEKQGGLFSPQERVRIIQKVLRGTISPEKVVRIAGSTARYAERMDISTIIRGRRNIVDEVAENTYARLSIVENSDLSFEVFDANETLQDASSSAAKELIKIGHDPANIIKLSVQEALTSRILSQYPVYITGGMGAGKSTVARRLEQEANTVGIPVKRIELDTIAHDIYSGLTDPYYAKIRKNLAETFSSSIATDAEWIDRAKLAEALFSPGTNIFDENKLEILNNIMTPAIRFRYQDMIEGFHGIILVEGVITACIKPPPLVGEYL